MIDKERKQNLLKELEKIGVVYFACLKVGIDKATFYRWKKTNKKFNALATKAIRTGRENMCDMAEYALLQNVKAKKMDAIKYTLSHNSSRYKPKSRKVTIEHSNSSKDNAKHFTTEYRKYMDKTSKEYKKLVEDLRKAKELKEVDNAIKFVDFSGKKGKE